LATLEARGYLDLGASVRVSYVVSPRDWAEMGMAFGIPSAGTGDRGGAHHALGNVIVAGSGVESGRLAAQRVIGAL
jgi:phytoene desaturase